MRHVLILAAFLLLWTAALALFSVPDYLVPSPFQLVEKTWFLVTRAGLLWHIPVTVIEIIAGYVIGVLIGIAAALVFYRAPVIEDILNPLIVFIQTAPKIAIAPLLLLWLGLDMTPKVVLVAIVTFFPILATMLFSGLKVAATLAVTAAVIGELMGARAGLGYLLSLGQETSDTQLVLVSVLILSLLGYLLYLAIQAAERRLLRWHASTDHDNLPI